MIEGDCMLNIRTLFGCICMTILLTACGKEPALPQIEQAETALSKKSTLTKYGGSTAEACVWSVVIEDGSHTWPREQFAGFDTNSLILEFFDTIAESLSTT